MAVLGLLAVVSLRSAPEQSVRPAQPGTSDAVADPTTQARLAVMRRSPDDPLALGPVTAPVVISEWGDFQCPFCRAFNADTAPALMSQYVNTGRVRLEWHDLAKLGPESVLAARAARAAGRQGSFWRFHDILYRDQSPENSGALTEASLTAMAKGLGLDADRFGRDFVDPDIAAVVDEDQRAGARLGITHVPSFLVNGTLLFGTQPLVAFQETIDGALNGVR